MYFLHVVFLIGIRLLSDEGNDINQTEVLMGYVYTDDDVANLRIPKIGDFSLVSQAFRESFGEIERSFNDIFPAATIFGGCATGRVNVCSDIDVLVLINDTSTTKRSVFEIINNQSDLWIALQMAQHKFIQVSVYPVFLTDLRLGETKYDKQFLRHVVASAKSEGLLFGSYRSFEDFRRDAPEHTLIRAVTYIDRKKENLEKRPFSFRGLSQEDVARMYLDTYQAPFHALRRVFDLWNMKYEDSKQGLILALREVAEEKLWFALDDLNKRWKEYVVYIENASFHKGMEASPFSVDDVHKSLYILGRLRELAKSVSPTHKK